MSWPGGDSPSSSTTRSPSRAGAFASATFRAVVRKDVKEVNPESEEEIKAYNHFAAEHEHLMAKSLLLRRHDLARRFHGRRPASARLPLLARRRRPGPRRLRGPLRRRPADRLPGRARRPHPLRLLRRHDDHLARLSSQQMLYAHLDGLYPGHAARPRLSRDPRPASTAGDPGSKRHGGSALHDRRDAPRRLDPGARSMPRRVPPTATSARSTPARTSSTGPCRPRRSRGSSDG